MFFEIYSWGPVLAGLSAVIVLILIVVGMYISKPSYDTIQENTGKYFWCCTRLAAMVLKEAFLMIYVRLETNSGHMSIDNFCQLTGNGYPGRFFRFPDERAKLQKDPITEFLDVPFMCRVLTDVLPSCHVEVPYRLSRIANELRMKRNKICHEDFLIDSNTLKREFSNFKEIFSEALGEAGRATGTNVSDRIQCIEDEMDKALAGATLHNSNEILSEVSKVRNERAGSAMTATRRNLMSAVRDLKNTDVAIKAHFQMKDNPILRPIINNQAEVELPTLKIGQRKISVPKLLVTCFKLTETHNPSILVFWSSGSGIRRVMLHHLRDEWATKSQVIYGLDSFDLVILIDGNENLNNSLDQCKHPQIPFNNQETKGLLKEMKVLFLLDEVEPSSLLLQQFLAEFPQAYFIVTTPSKERFKLEQKGLGSQRKVLLIQLNSKNNFYQST